jgi:4-hydroxy-tetrahydrodipicolinate reductase
MKIILSGYNGRMGKAIIKKLPVDCEIMCGVTKNPAGNEPCPVYKKFSEIESTGDVIIDFTVAGNVGDVLNFAVEKKIPLVIGTTGIDENLKKDIINASKEIPILYSGNTSFGVSLMIHLVKEAVRLLDIDKNDIEIIEKHDRNKLDAPSGTSKMIINGINESSGKNYKVLNGRNEETGVRTNEEIGLHSFRGGNIASEHYVSFASEDEIIEINHKAMSFDIFAVGAIKAAKIIIDKSPGLYSMDDMIKSL